MRGRVARGCGFEVRSEGWGSVPLEVGVGLCVLEWGGEVLV